MHQLLTLTMLALEEGEAAVLNVPAVRRVAQLAQRKVTFSLAVLPLLRQGHRPCLSPPPQ